LPAQAQTFQPQPSVELPAELERVLRDYEQAWATNNAEALAALFTEKGFVPSNAGWIAGRDAIAKKYASTGGDLRLRAVYYQVVDTVGYIIGAYGYGVEAAQVDRGNFILALKKSDQGKWLIVADLDKGNQVQP
jgi:ketosteroid isomerase-like protein